MGTLIESYEQQYSSLTADITFNIGRISNTHGGNAFFVYISNFLCILNIVSIDLVDQDLIKLVYKLSKVSWEI